MNASGPYPPNMFVAGKSEGRDVVPALIQHNGKWKPGKVMPELRQAFVAEDGVEHKYENVPVYIMRRFSDRMVYRPVVEGRLPQGAMTLSSLNSQPFYFARVEGWNGHEIGFSHHPAERAYVANGAKEHVIDRFEILSVDL